MLSIILPVLNEAENLKILIPALSASLKKEKHEIIVVDDNSRDDTQKIMASYKKRYPLHYLLRREKKGLSSAVIDGFGIAKGDRYIVMDSDLSHPPELIGKLVKALDRHDIVIASRYIEGGGAVKWSLLRKAVSVFATILTRPLVKIKDPLAGYFGLKKSVIRDVELNPIGFKILLEILIKGKYKNIIELPYMFLERRSGKSKANIKIYIQYNVQLLELYFYRLKCFIKRFIS